MKSKLLTKYFLLAAAVIIVFLVLGSMFSMYINDQLRTRRNNIPPLFIAKIIDRLDPSDKINAVRRFEETQDSNMRARITLYDDTGTVVYGKEEAKLPPEFLKKFEKDYDFFQNPNSPAEPREGRRGPPPFGFFPGGGGRPPPHSDNLIIRLSGTPVYYLEMSMQPRPAEERENSWLPLMGPLLLLVSLLLGVAATILLIYASVRKRVAEADVVLTQIQSGNLKARFKVSRKDEFGEAMLRFNRMADEIEALVDHLKDVESSRNKILQELAHDLRTPVASLKNLLETIESQNEKLAPELRRELAQLSLREVDYFGQLVEDLLLLAQVDEPKYKVENKSVVLNEVLDEVITDCLARPLYKSKNLRVEKKYEVSSAEIFGSYNLLYRMFRNAVENAMSFAGSQILVELKRDGAGGLQFTIADDGPGLSQEQMAHFGERKLSRQITDGDQSKRLSIGLGSVIIKKISKIHRGEVSIRNRSGGVRPGAVLTISFHDVKMP